MDGAYEFAEGEAEDLSRIVAKLRSNLKSRDAIVKHLKIVAEILEKLPQDLAALGSARHGLEEVLVDKHVLGSKHKDVKMYAAVCLSRMLRIYAPETPYDDKDLEPVFDLLLWSVQQVQEYQSPMFELAVSVLQTIGQTKSYFLLLDMGREDVVLDWVRTLLQCINAGSSAVAGPHAMEVLNGIVGDEGTTNAVLEVLLSQLVPPRSLESPASCQLAQAVLKACEVQIKPQLQKFLTTLILSPISSNSDLHKQAYSLIYQLYQSVPQVLLPVIPHVTNELAAENANRRLEAVRLLCKLFSLPGSKLACEYEDVLVALLGRYADIKLEVRITLLEATPDLVAAAGAEELQQKVVKEASTRLQDMEEKVRISAVKNLCKAAQRLLVGPAATVAGAAGTTVACRSNQLTLATPTADLFGSLGSQEEDDIAAADLGVVYTPPTEPAAGSAGAAVGLGAGAAGAGVRELKYVDNLLQHVSMRLRDTKLGVRQQAASSLMAVFRAVAAAADGEQLNSFCWIPNRLLLCIKSDVPLRSFVVEGIMKDGLLSPQVPASQAAAAWARLWLTAKPMERDALMMLLASRVRLQSDALRYLELRRKLSGKDRDKEAEPAAYEAAKEQLEQAARRLAAQMPQPEKANEGLTALQGVRDNHVFGALLQALAPAATQQAVVKARADALSRVGSRSIAADLISQLLLWARPASWLPNPLLAALLDVVPADPEGQQGDLVLATFQLLQRLGKAAPILFSSLLPQLSKLLQSSEADLQQLGAQLIAHCALQHRKRGTVLAASPDAATAKLVKQQLLPCMRALCRGNSSAGAADAAAGRHMDGDSAQGNGSDGGEEEEQFFDAMDVDSQAAAAAAGMATPKAAKWAVYGIAFLQDGNSTRKELHKLADELSAGLDSATPETAAKLQALSAVGRLVPDAFGRHVEQLLSFVLDDYLLTYLDATATAPAAAAAGGSIGRSPGSSLLSPGADSSLQSPGAGGGGSSQFEAAAVWLKAAALKALAAGCVPDSDSSDVPVETQRVVARLAQDLEGLLEPGADQRPEFLGDAPPDMAGQLRLAAASSLLRLARRHDCRLPASCYVMLALVMQDELDGVRAAFAGKVFKLVNHFNMRPSTHQLAAKYAAMLPLAAMDPARANKDAAARLLRDWVHARRAAVQQLIMAAASGAAADGARGGGSTLQDLPEMVLPYGLYILAHHPDFPQDEDAEDPSCYEPFQYMLQFMLQPLLVVSGSTPAGATTPALLKMCRTLKRTADTAEAPCSAQLYTLCDMAAATVTALAEAMGVSEALQGQYPGSITLPKGLYRPLDKEERGAADVSYLPPGFEVALDPEPAAALAQPKGQPAAAAGGTGRGSKPRSAAGQARATAAAAGGGRGSKRKAPAHSKAAAAAAADDDDDSGGGGEDEGGEERAVKRTKGGGKAAAAAAGGAKRGRGGRRAAPARSDSDDGWGCDDEGISDAPPTATKSDQQLTRRQRDLQQHKQQQQAAAGRSDNNNVSEDAAAAAPAGGQHNKRQAVKQQQQRAAQAADDADSGGEGGAAESEQELDSQPDTDKPAAAKKQQLQKHKRPSRQQQQQQQAKLKQQPLFFQAALPADASSPAPVRPRKGAAAVIDSKPCARAAPAVRESDDADDDDDDARSGDSDADASDEGHSPPPPPAAPAAGKKKQHIGTNGVVGKGPGAVRGQQAAAGARGRGAAAQPTPAADANAAAGRRQQQQQAKPGKAAAAAAEQKQGKGAAAGGGRGRKDAEAAADEDASRQEDQGDATQGTAAAAKRRRGTSSPAVASKGTKAAAAAAAAGHGSVAQQAGRKQPGEAAAAAGAAGRATRRRAA